MNQPENALAVANHFLYLAKQHWPKKRINKMGMNHLVYYAHGWHHWDVEAGQLDLTSDSE